MDTIQRKNIRLSTVYGYGWGIYNLAQDGATDVVWNGYANDVMEEVIMVFPNICANESGQGRDTIKKLMTPMTIV